MKTYELQTTPSGPVLVENIPVKSVALGYLPATLAAGLVGGVLLGTALFHFFK